MGYNKGKIPRIKMASIDHLKTNKSFCTKAWTGLSITPAGACNPCCLFETPIIDKNSKPLRIDQNNIEAIYNGQFMLEVRQKMLKGEEVVGCRQCYQIEEIGGRSMRMEANETQAEIILDYQRTDKLIPKTLDLKINNKCNLKCRMCQPRDSHLLEKEFFEISQEMKEFDNYSNANQLDPDLGIPLKEIKPWEDSECFKESLEKIFANGLTKITAVGGEPFLMDKLFEILDSCLDREIASEISVGVTTNLMFVPQEKIQKYLNAFEMFLFNISLDATGKELNYIRYPSNFEKIVKNFKEIYQDSPKVKFQFSPTYQVYNVLYLTDILEFVESLMDEGYKFTENAVNITFLSFPEHLNPRILPENIRNEAKKKLRTFLVKSKYLKNLPLVLQKLVYIIELLENETLNDSDKMLSEFLFYTEILDKKRGQRIQDYVPELDQLLRKNNIVSKAPSRPYYKIREDGWALAADGKIEEAIHKFENSLELSHDKYLDYREMGWMHHKLGKLEKSFHCYKKGIELNPDDPYLQEGYNKLKGNFKRKVLKLLRPFS